MSAKRQAVQNVIDNLQISTLEYRNETDPDVLPYVHARKIEQITVNITPFWLSAEAFSS